MVEQIESDPSPVEEEPQAEDGQQNQEVSIQEACEEYKQSVRVTLRLINGKLNESLKQNLQSLEELYEKIAARTRFLENNPTFLACLPDITQSIQQEAIREFDDIKIDLKQESQKIFERLQETEAMHEKLFNLVTKKHQLDDELKLLKVEEIPEKETPTKETDNVIKSSYSSLNFQYFPDLKADVWRGKPFEDIHMRLIQQLEATDSLEGFLKHMNRKPSEKKKKHKKQKCENLEEKYPGSLWFFHRNMNHRFSRVSVASKSSKGSQISQGRLKKTKMTHSNPSQKISGNLCSCNLLVTSSQSPYMSNEEKAKKVKQQLQMRHLKCYDLLDDIEKKDLKPLQSEYPRRDNIFSSEDLHKFKNLQNYKSYLHKMLEDSEITWRRLLAPLTPKPVKKLKRHNTDKKVKEQKFMGEEVTSLMKYLTQPKESVFHPQSVIVMPVRVIYDRFPTKDKPLINVPPLKREGSNLSKASSNKSKGFVTDLTISPPQTFRTPRTSENSPRTVDSARKPAHVLFRAENVQKFADASQSPMVRKKLMLEHLRGLKARNDTIQKNIQKAIDVIETKMLDILSSPQDSNSTEAFNAMEKEITKVLKMMNDGDKKEGDNKKVEKVEAEKDENCQKKHEQVPKMKRGVTMVRKNNNNSNNSNNSGDPGILEFVPGVDLGKNVVKSPRVIFLDSDNTKPNVAKTNKTESDKKDVQSNKILKPENENQESNNRKVLVQERNGKLLTLEKKKAANIEEGERLLGQVDNVIKKIDSIYTKFYTEKNNKPKSPATKIDKEKENAYSNVIEFFDGLKQIIDTPPIEVFYKKTENIAQKFQQAKVYDQASVYHTITKINEAKSEVVEEGQGDVVELQDESRIFIYEENLTILGNRHKMILNTFYTIFFSGVFVAMNLDFTS